MPSRSAKETGEIMSDVKKSKKRTRRARPRATELKAIAAVKASDHIGPEHDAMVWALRDMAQAIDRQKAGLEGSMFGDPAAEKLLAWLQDLYVRFLSSLLLTPKSQAEADQIDDFDSDPLEQLQAKIVSLADRR